MSLFNFASGSIVVTLAASASQASTLTGAAVDLLDYDGNIAIVQSHGIGTGTLDGKIQDSADGSTGWVDVAGATFVQSTTTADIQKIVFAAKSTRRFIRYIGTIVTGPQNLSVILIGLKKST
jgi:hypothetical protein